MSHLSRDERLLALDEALDAAAQAHLAWCPVCRADVESLASVVARVKAVHLPEPSPLFWDLLAARVGAVIADEPQPARPREAAWHSRCATAMRRWWGRLRAACR